MAKCVEAAKCAEVISEKYNIPLSDLVDVFAEVPTADVVEVKHGEWIEVNQTGTNHRHIKYTTKKCSVCGYCNGRRKTKHCPERGAKMDERSDTYDL